MNGLDTTEKHLNKKGTVIRLAANDWSRQPSAALGRVNGLDTTEKQLSKGEVDKFLSEFVDFTGADDGTRTRTAVGH